MTPLQKRLLIRAAAFDFGEAHVSKRDRAAAIYLHAEGFGIFYDGHFPKFKLFPNVRKNIMRQLEATICEAHI